MKKLLLITCFFSILVSCTSNETSISKLKEQVMAVHDEVMPKMGELRSTSKALKAAAEEKEGQEDMLAAESLNRAADAINVANEGMMMWMREFEMDFKGTEQETRKYLNDQLTKVNKVKTDMLTALESGKSLLNQ